MLQFVYDHFQSVDLLLALLGAKGVFLISRGWKQPFLAQAQPELSTIQAQQMVRNGTIWLSGTFVLLIVCCLLTWFWRQSVETLLIGTGLGIIGFSAFYILLVGKIRC
ncbi:MAG: hypothetical protein M3Z08_03200 [Chloroflexota bacterium]|nr:hypothetical protein [Chloroflexota bacterium]